MKAVENKVWPKIRVEYFGPKREIISLKDAAKRFKLDKRNVEWLRKGQVAGSSVLRSGVPDVRMIWRYTQEDAIRDAAPELLTALQGIMDHDLVPAESVAGKLALRAIRKATE